MKNIFYILFTITIIFSACEKSEVQVIGCSDINATNYDPNANVDGLCIYPSTRIIVTTVDENGQPLSDVVMYLNNSCVLSGFKTLATSNEDGIAEFLFMHSSDFSFYDNDNLQAGETYKIFATYPLTPPWIFEACGEVELPYYNTVNNSSHNTHNFDVYLTLTMTAP